jgi:hypothetical protein
MRAKLYNNFSRLPIAALTVKEEAFYGEVRLETLGEDPDPLVAFR